MKLRPTFLTLMASLALGLVACQDSGVVEPDEVISPDDPVALFGKPTCDNGATNWPKCTLDPGGEDPATNTGTVWFELSLDGRGLTGGPESGLPIQVNNRNKLDMSGPTAVHSSLSATYGSFEDGSCLNQNPGDLDDEIFGALAKELWVSGDGAPGTPAPEAAFVNTRVLIDKKKLGGESSSHFISIGYDTGNPDLGWVWLGIGNEVLNGDFGYVTVSEPTPVTVSEGDFAGTYQKYVFSGGPVRVSPTAYGVSETPALVCPLLEDVEVWIKFP